MSIETTVIVVSSGEAGRLIDSGNLLILAKDIIPHNLQFITMCSTVFRRARGNYYRLLPSFDHRNPESCIDCAKNVPSKTLFIIFQRLYDDYFPQSITLHDNSLFYDYAWVLKKLVLVVVLACANQFSLFHTSRIIRHDMDD